MGALDTTEQEKFSQYMLFINPVTVLILSHMLLLNYLDLRLYVCLNQNSVVLTKNGAFWAPFLCCGVPVNLGLS